MDFPECIGFEWDEGNVHKIRKRIDQTIAELAFSGSPYVAFDDIHSREEKRWFLINRVFENYVFLIFTVRNRLIRIISARYMHRREAKKYEVWFTKKEA
jgi:uncharacterized DUF497 family protein